MVFRAGFWAYAENSVVPIVGVLFYVVVAVRVFSGVEGRLVPGLVLVLVLVLVDLVATI